MAKLSFGRMTVGVVLGLLSGLLLAFELAISPMLMPVPIFIAFLWLWSGWPGAVASSVSTLGMSVLIGGWPMATAVGAVMVLPGWLSASLVFRRMRFYSGIKASVGIQLGLLIAVLIAAWLYVKGNLVDVAMNALRASLDSSPITGALLAMLGQMGFFGAQTGLDFSAALDAVQQKQLLDAMFSAYTAQYKLTAPAMLLHTGLVTGSLSYLLPVYVCARRGDEPTVSFAHPHEWRLSANTIIGLPVCVGVSLVLNELGVSGADALYVALVNVLFLALTVQAIGAVSRWMRAAGFTPGKRVLLVLAMILFTQVVLRLIGVYSALFGSKGLISTYIKKRTEKRNKGE